MLLHRLPHLYLAAEDVSFRPGLSMAFYPSSLLHETVLNASLEPFFFGSLFLVVTAWPKRRIEFHALSIESVYPGDDSSGQTTE